MTADLAGLGIGALRRGFAAKTFTPIALMEALLERVDRLDGELHAFLRLDREEALAAAHRSTREQERGDSHGLLHGVPIAVKDIMDVAGEVTTCHSAIPAAVPARRDAAVVARLRTAGAIPFGKTALHEFAIGGPAFDLPWPPARNPWDRSRHPGGSSSGSAVAVAARLAPGALGTDTGGSVRHPATCCGLVGLKPTYGLIECSGVFPLAPSLDHVGVMTRTVEDCAILLDAIATRGPARADGYAAALAMDAPRGVKGLRIGVIAHFYEEDERADAVVRGGIQSALDVLQRLDAEIEPARVSPLKAWAACGRVIQQAEQFAVHELWLRTRPEQYSRVGRNRLVAGAFLGALDLVRAGQARQALREEFDRLMQRFDAVVTVSSMTLPCAIDDPAALASTYERHARMPFNLTGTPALALPVGYAPEGLPLGIQIAAGAGNERTLLRIAAAYESAAPWQQRRPPVA